MLNIFILEDDYSQQSYLEKIVKAIIVEKSLKCKSPEIFGKPGHLIETISERGGPQLFLLDIEIKGEEQKGLDIAKEIRKKNPNAIIVFVTTHSEFMPITFKYKIEALDFIDKTLEEQDFYRRVSSSIEYALKKLETTAAQDSFTLENSTVHIKVPFNDILYFETSPTVHKVILHTRDERMEFYASISEIEKVDERLYRCHRSFVVNPENITKIDKVSKIAIFDNNNRCLVSRLKYRGLLEKIKS